MRLVRNIGRLLPGCLLLAAGFVAGARADTIVLKNGRRIVAAGVTRANGKVSYETPAGQMSLPESAARVVALLRERQILGWGGEGRGDTQTWI